MTDAWIMLLSVGMAAGLLGGLLGIGGGILLMPVLRFGLHLTPADAAGTTVLAVWCTTLAGGLKHYRLGHVPLRALVPVMISGAVSTLLCSLLFARWARTGFWLDLGIGAVFTAVALRMLWDAVARAPEQQSNAPDALPLHGGLLRKALLGAGAGILPGLFGIGTGAVLVPAFRYCFRAPIKVAIGASLACFCANALISAAFKYAQGYVRLDVAVPLCGGCVLGAQLGAMINQRAPARWLGFLFGLLFLSVAARFLYTGMGECLQL